MRMLTLVGAVGVVFGFVILFQRGIAGLFDFSYSVVTLVGVLALVQGVRYGLARRGADRSRVDLGDPEMRYEVDAPGTEIDDRLRRTSGFKHTSSRRRERLRGRIRDVAAEAVSRRESVSRRTADRLIADGSWTDDSVSTAFLAEGGSYPISAYVRARIAGESTFAYGMRRAIEEIEGVERIDGTEEADE